MTMGRGFRMPGEPDPRHEVDEELGFHLDMRAQQLIDSGMSPEEARETARREFGDLDQTRRYCEAEDRRLRRGRWMKHLVGTVTAETRQAVQRILRRPGAVFAPLAILTLAVTLNVLVLSVVRGVLLAPLPFQEGERVVTADEVREGGGYVRVAYPVLAAWREQSRLAEELSAYLDTSFPVMTESGPINAEGAAVTAGFFNLLSNPIARGRAFTEEDHLPGSPPVALISEGLWIRVFGEDPGILGHRLEVDGQVSEIVGVVRSGAVFPDRAEVWRPVEQANPGLMDVAGAKIFVALARLRPGVGPDPFAAELGDIGAGVVGGSDAAAVTALDEQILGSVRGPLRLLQGAVLLVLLAAAVNAGGLLLARGIRRRGETALRASLGAGSKRLASGLLLEGAILGAGAGVAGLLFAYVLLDPALTLVPVELPRAAQISLSPWVASFAFLLACITGIASSSAGALAGSRTQPAALLRESSPSAGSTPWLARALEGMVVVQVALAVLLTAGAGLLLRSFVATLQEDPGFEAANVVLVNVSLPDYRYTDVVSRVAFARDLLGGARGLSGAEAVALGRNLPISGSNMTSPLLVDGGSGTTPAVQVASVTEDYFDVLQIPILEGRGMDGADREDGEAVMLVDPTVATADGGTLGVGDRAHSFFGNQEFREVRGVVGAVRHRGLRVSPVPIVYEPFFQKGGAGGFTLLVRSEAPTAVIAGEVRTLIQSLDPALPIDQVSTMSSRIGASLAEPRFYTLSLSIFGGLALLLALAGCQASLSHRVASRKREIGIRMALGATIPGVRSMVRRRGLVLTVLGSVIGAAAAVPSVRVLESQLYGITAGDPLTFFGVLLLLLVVGALASDVPARRAARQDPASVLKEA